MRNRKENEENCPADNNISSDDAATPIVVKNGTLKTKPPTLMSLHFFQTPRIFRKSGPIPQPSDLQQKANAQSLFDASSNADLTNLLAISLNSMQRRSHLDLEKGTYKSIYSISRAIHPLLVLLRLAGMFPVFPKNGERSKSARSFTVSFHGILRLLMIF